MSYMNIKKSDVDETKYDVDYVANHTPGNVVVDEQTAKLLVLAKEAGASELAREMRKLLELNW